jgi:plastocyanin
MTHRVIVIHGSKVFPKELHVKAGHTLQFHSNDADFEVAFNSDTPIGVQGEKGNAGVAGPNHTIKAPPGTYSYTVKINGVPIDPEIIVDPGGP